MDKCKMTLRLSDGLALLETRLLRAPLLACPAVACVAMRSWAGLQSTIMPPRPPHRKQIKHYEHLGHVRELTFSCYRRLPLLTNDVWREMLSRAMCGGKC